MSWPVGSAYGKGPTGPGATVPSAPDSMAPARSGMPTLAEKLQGGTGGGATVAGMPPKKLETVKVDGLVLLKIIKHCTESLPELCTGSLLGLDVGNTLEVTNSFPFPAAETDEDGETSTNNESGAAFQRDMLKLLRDVNVDCNSVGWYRSTYLGSFCTNDLVQQLFQYQEQLDQGPAQKSVVLVYDPFQTKRGHLALKAYRLTDVFMKYYRDRKSGNTGASGTGAVKLSPSVVAAIGGLPADGSAQMQTSEHEISAEEIFEELPIEISNAHLFTVLVNDLKQRNGHRLDVDFDRLNLNTNAYLSSNVDFLVEEADNLLSEQFKKSRDKRTQQRTEMDQVKFITQRRMENEAREERGEAPLPEIDPSNPIFKPQAVISQLESLLIQKQIGIYTDQINRFSGSGFSKLYLAGALQKSNSS